MTREEKIGMFAMRLDGKSYRDIGQKFGVSTQRVWEILSSTVNPRETDAHGRVLEKVLYPGIAGYMRRRNMSLTALAGICDLSQATVRNALICGRGPGKDTIDKILKGTGMTYEEAFGNA